MITPEIIANTPKPKPLIKRVGRWVLAICQSQLQPENPRPSGYLLGEKSTLEQSGIPPGWFKSEYS